MYEALPGLVEASRALENESVVVCLAASGLAAACPRSMALVYSLRGRPARAIGAVWATDGRGPLASSVLTGFRQAFEWAPTFYDRSHVDASQRNRWVDLPVEWFRGTEYGRVFRPFATMGRYLLCEGSRPLACLGVLLREGEPPLSERERRHLEEAATKAARPVRISVLLAEVRAYQDAVEHLMASRADATVLLNASGTLLAASAGGMAALDGRPGLRKRLMAAAAGASRLGGASIDLETSLEIRLTPCSPRGGGASALLAFLGEAPLDGRARVTPRQAELLEILGEGLSNAQIAERMGIRSSTVKTMLELLYSRTGASGRVGLLRWARRSNGRSAPPAGTLPAMD